MEQRVDCYVGGTVIVKVMNRKGEYSVYRIKITKEDLAGDGLSDVFLQETTGTE